MEGHKDKVGEADMRRRWRSMIELPLKELAE